MRRLATGLCVAVATVAFAGCVGDTDPAINVTNVSATLKAHGHTDDGPATWWWEYDTVRAELGTASDTEICGTAPQRRCGPASSSADVPLSQSVTKLTPNTTYYFRACGQDAGEGPTCGRILSFKTLAGTSYAYDRQWGTPGGGNGQFFNPTGVATDAAGNVYVSDLGYDRIQKFNSTGTYITQWGTAGTGNRQFREPYGIAIDGAGNVYVADTDNNRIQKFNSTGTYITQWGTFGSGNRQFNGPRYVAADSAGNVYVSDTGNGRVQKFSSTGTYLSQWGTFGSGNGQFGAGPSTGPTGVATDSIGNVYVGDQFNHRIQKFNSTGTYIAQSGSNGTANGQFRGPLGVATDSAGSVYVVDRLNHRTQKFNSTPSFITKFGSFGAGNGQFSYPEGVATDATGNVYITDTQNHRVQKFRPSL